MNARGRMYEIVPYARALPDDAKAGMCRQYFDARSARYDESERQDNGRRRYHDAIDSYVLSRLSGLGTCGVIVSLGCGTGRREAKIAGKLGAAPRIIGIEPSPRMGAIAASRGVEVLSDVSHIGPQLRSAVDAVLCLFSFVHLPSKPARLRVLRALCGLLRPSGILIVDVFNVHDRFEWGPTLDSVSPGAPAGGLPDSGDVFYRRAGSAEVSFMHYFTLGEITHLLEAAGLVITDVAGVGYAREPGRVGVPLDEGPILLSCRKPAVVNSALGE